MIPRGPSGANPFVSALPPQVMPFSLPRLARKRENKSQRENKKMLVLWEHEPAST